MVEQVQITEMIIPDVDTIGPNEPVRVARRRMESQTRRSLIVVDEDRPIGVIQWRDIAWESDVNADAQVAEHMVREFPVLRTGMTVKDAQARLGDVDFDRLPVVDEQGHLVGEVPRTVVAHYGEVAEETPSAEVGMSAYRSPQERQGETVAAGSSVADEGVILTVASGMTVKGSGGKKLGTVDQVILDQMDRLAAFTVEHGLLGRKHKRIPADVVDRVEGDEVTLSIGTTEFNMLADVEDRA